LEKINEAVIEMLNKIKFIEKTYDIMRVVDPVNQRVLTYKENGVVESDIVCYHFWNKEISCNNCVSIRAYKENDVFIKLEYQKDSIFMVLAIPVKLEEDTVVIELLKDVSKNMLVVNKDDGVEVDVHSIMTNTNNLLLKDHLTGIFNRRYIDERMQVEVINNSLQMGSLSLIMADIDFFKNVNDTYGHLAGDYILKEVSNILVSCIRTGKDWAARYGGEEFLVCLPNTSNDIAAKIAERMREKIENKVFEFEGQKIHLTTSFGVYTLVQADESSIETIIDKADKNLYKAKNSGRNAVISN
jgi:two-component system, cell cycle response regulator